MCLLWPTATPSPRVCACAGPDQCCKRLANMPTFLLTAIRTASHDSLLHHFLISLHSYLHTDNRLGYHRSHCVWACMCLTFYLTVRDHVFAFQMTHSLTRYTKTDFLLLYFTDCTALPYSTRLSLKSGAHVPHCLLPSYHLGRGVLSSSHACETARQPHHLISSPLIAATMDGHTHVRTMYRHKKLSFSFGKKG